MDSFVGTFCFLLSSEKKRYNQREKTKKKRKHLMVERTLLTPESHGSLAISQGSHERCCRPSMLLNHVLPATSQCPTAWYRKLKCVIFREALPSWRCPWTVADVSLLCWGCSSGCWSHRHSVHYLAAAASHPRTSEMIPAPLTYVLGGLICLQSLHETIYY